MASDFSIRLAARQIKHGDIIAYPTDTIYGLGCDPFNAGAVERLNCIKQRPQNKQFILLAGQLNQIEPLIKITQDQKKRITQTTEPTSWIIDASLQAPTWLVDKKNTITIRLSQNDVVKNLCHALGHAITSTSVNPSGYKPATNNLSIRKYFGDSIYSALASNKKLTAKPSKIIRLCDNRIIRN